MTGIADVQPPEEVYWEHEMADTPEPPDEYLGPWYFTFGVAQPNAGRFVKIENATYLAAREQIIRTYGQEWSMQYDAEQWVDALGRTQQERWGLVEIR